MKIIEKLTSCKHKAIMAFGPAVAVAAASVPALASGSDVSGGGALDSVVVTTDMLTPIVDAVTSNVRVILPIGIIIFGILLGIGLIRGILKRVSGA